MSEETALSPVTERHSLMFGVIINLFATLEVQIQIAAAGILGSDLGTALIMMSDTHYRQKRQTLRHLNTTLGVNGIVSAELNQLLDDIHDLSTLRNQIAHCMWVEGNRPGSIKPTQIKLRGDTPKTLGHWHNERSYTADDLREEARKLDAIHCRFSEFLETSGLEARVAAKIAEIPESSSASPGNPSSK